MLFGSQVSGKTHPHSDVDLALWPSHPVPALTRLRWLRVVTRKPVGASDAEIEANPRARSARLRGAERLEAA